MYQEQETNIITSLFLFLKTGYALILKLDPNATTLQSSLTSIKLPSGSPTAM